MSRRKRLIKEILSYLLLVLAILGLFYVFAYKGSSGVPSTTKELQLQEKSSHNNIAVNGFTLVPLSGNAKVQLINMSGNPVHQWPVDAARARLLPNGNLLVIHGSKWGTFNQPWRALRRTIREYSWEGEVVWEYTAPYVIHHDLQRLSNGNTLLIYRSLVPNEYKKRIADMRRRQLSIRTDIILEVTPDGEVVWQWAAHDHLDLNSCGRLPCTAEIGDITKGKKVSDWTHINTISILPENKYFDLKKDPRFKPGNILIVPRNWWMAMILDRETKEIVWEYRGKYKGGLSGGHEAQMIEKGLAGAGNILIFDNGVFKHRGRSFILEINPLTKNLDWVYDRGKEFFSNSSGSVQRLANGHTLISEDLKGYIFEVDRKKEKVWSYQAPERVSRARRYPVNYCEQFKTLDLY